MVSTHRGASRARLGNAPAAREWTVIETLRGNPDQISVVLKKNKPQTFLGLGRASLPRTMLEITVADCLRSGVTISRSVTVNDGRTYRLVTMPIIGPTGSIYAVIVWSASIIEQMPQIPKVGAMEWSPSGVLTATPAAAYLLRPPNDRPAGHTVPELLASFEDWEDKFGFFAMFEMFSLNGNSRTDEWAGSAYKRYEDGTLHKLHIAARAVGTGAQRRIRAVVCDVPTTDHPTGTDVAVAALRAVPILPGHALALVDLGTAFVHEWITDDPHLAGWPHHHPTYDNDGRARVAATCYDLALGQPAATVEARIRFNPLDDWIDIHSQWKRLDTIRPQAILDITPAVPHPPPISGCSLCADLVDPRRLK
ncbi:GAF domain-containing protein [Nocardia sp. NPDC051832]|uniref:GAF domain-containing protein n=1 Tax=Nocardia sp. NPDC051832 TaxID=3155673 RepID=UPI00342CC827